MEPIIINVKIGKSDAFDVEVNNCETVETLAALLVSLRPEIGENFRTCHKGKFLENEEVLRAIGVSTGDTIVVAIQGIKPEAASEQTASKMPSRIVASKGANLEQNAGRIDCHNLNWWFQLQYRSGGGFDLRGFKPERVEQIWVFSHTSGVHVWQDAMDLSQGADDVVVVFHYTDRKGFLNITSPEKQVADIWASLVTSGRNANAWYGQGVYASIKGPDDFYSDYEKDGFASAKHAIVDNNFRRMARLDGFDVYFARVEFCVPILVDPEFAFNICERCTPEMLAHGHGPGKNIKGELLNEEHQPIRDQWVVRIADDGVVKSARASILMTLEHRVAMARSRQEPSSISDLVRFASVLQARNHFVEARDTFYLALQAIENDSDPRWKGVKALTQNDLGLLFKEMGQPEEACKILDLALLGHLSLFGADCTYTWTCKNNLALALQDSYLRQRMFRAPNRNLLLRSKALMEESLEGRMHGLGNDAMLTIQSKSNLGLLLIPIGNKKKAKQLLEESYADYLRVCGPEHHDTLRSLNNLCMFFTQSDQAKDAVPLLRRGLAACECAFGSDHVGTITTTSNLAGALQLVGETDEAETLARRAFEASLRLSGPNATLTQGCEESLRRISLARRGTSQKPKHVEIGGAANDARARLKELNIEGIADMDDETVQAVWLSLNLQYNELDSNTSAQ